MSIDKAVNLEDLHRLARKKIPKIVFDFIEGGVEDEVGMARNEDAFRELKLLPRYMVDVSVRDTSTTLFGRTYSSPVGISPTGIAGIFRRGADLMLAEAAREANVPFIMSGASTASIEELARVTPEHGWYQLYMAKDKAISHDQVRRAADAGLSTLVVTVDVPIRPRRERNIRNGFARPLHLSLATRLDALRYPEWLLDYLRHGTPLFSNWVAYAPKGANADAVADFFESQTPATVTWDDIAALRKLWPRNFVIKGIMRTDDALRAASIGIDGIMVSNHGGRQLDRAPSPIDVLPAIVDAAGDRLTVMLDGGVRRGADAVAALCLGTQFLFQGRPTLYGAVAGGTAGATQALTILQREVDLTLGQIGVPTLAQLGPDMLMWDRMEDRRRNTRV